MHHFKHKFAVLQHLVVKIPAVITIRDNLGNKKSSNYLNLMDLFKNMLGKKSLNSKNRGFMGQLKRPRCHVCAVSQEQNPMISWKLRTILIRLKPLLHRTLAHPWPAEFA